MLSLQLWGPPLLWVGSDRRHLDPKDALLLAWLALEGPTARARLAGFLFPEVDEAKARNNLRQRLFQLKKKLGVDVVVGEAVLRLVPELRTDLSAEGVATSAELLSGLMADDLDTLGPWLTEQRRQHSAKRALRWAQDADQAEAQQDFATALELALALVRAQPENESAHRRVMRLHYLRGHRAAARAAYDECRLALARHRFSAPSPETEALRHQIETKVQTSAAPAAMPQELVPLSVLRPPRLIGRDAFWTQLNVAWIKRRTVLLVGEAGLGKSRLLNDVLQAHAQGPEGPGVHVCARPGDERVPYAVLTKLLRQLTARVAPEAWMRPELARLLPELGSAAPLNTQDERAHLIRVVDEYWSHCGSRVPAIVLDDLHFADVASSEIVLRAAQNSPCAWFIAMRSPELAPTTTELLRTLTEEHAAQRLCLTPLTPDEIRVLVSSLELGLATDAAEALALTLYRRAGGNPLYTLEVLKAMLASGADLSQAHAAATPSPGGVSAVIGRRLEKLSPAALRLARCAAIAGQNFSISLAARLLGVCTLDLTEAWHELETAQVFRDGAFAHDLIFEAARAQVPRTIAGELHREIAGLIAATAAPATVAEHWRQAGEWARAGVSLMQAAQAAHIASRHAEEAVFLEQATACFARDGNKGQEFEALARWAGALTWVDIGQRHHTVLKRMLDTAQTPEQRLQVLTEMGYSEANRGNRQRSIDVAQEALDLATSLAQPDMAYKNAGTLAIGHVALGQHEAALAVLEAQRTWIEASGNARHQRDFESDLAWPLLALNRLSEAREGLERGIALAREIGELASLNTLLSLQVGSYSRAGDMVAALSVSSQAVALHEVLGSVSGVPLFDRAIHAWLRAHLGEYESALTTYDEVIAAFEASGNTLLMWRARTLRAITYVTLGQGARARQSLMQGRSDQDLVPLDHLALGLIERAADRMAHRAIGHKAAQHFAQADPSPRLGATTISLAEVARLYQIEALPPAEAHPAAAQLASVALAHSQHGVAIAALALFAQAAAACHEPGAAISASERALDLMERFQPEVMYRGDVWLALATALRQAGQTARASQVELNAAQWIEATARTQVPASFQESFLERNSTNRALRLAAVRAQRQALT